MLKKGNTEESITDTLEEDEVLLNQIFEAVRGFAPEYNLEEVLDFWLESREG